MVILSEAERSRIHARSESEMFRFAQHDTSSEIKFQ